MSPHHVDVHPQWNGEVPEQLFARLDTEPAIGDALRALGRALLATLDGRTAELVALRVAAVRGCAYVWTGHVVIALHRDDEGRLTREEIARVLTQPAAFSGPDAALLATVDDLLARVPVQASAPPLALSTAVLFYDLVCTIMAGAELDADPVPGLELTAGRAPRSVAPPTGR